jgi:hypothetical protein
LEERLIEQEHYFFSSVWLKALLVLTLITFGDIEELHLRFDVAVAVAVAIVVRTRDHFGLNVDLFFVLEEANIRAIDQVDHLAIVEMLDGGEVDTLELLLVLNGRLKLESAHIVCDFIFNDFATFLHLDFDFCLSGSIDLEL